MRSQILWHTFQPNFIRRLFLHVTILSCWLLPQSATPHGKTGSSAILGLSLVSWLTDLLRPLWFHPFLHKTTGLVRIHTYVTNVLGKRLWFWSEKSWMFFSSRKCHSILDTEDTQLQNQSCGLLLLTVGVGLCQRRTNWIRIFLYNWL